MISKWIQFTVLADHAETFEAELAQLEIASREEQGCAHYAAFRDVDAPDVFTVLENWDSPEAFEAHRISPHVKAFKARCGAMITAKSGQSLKPVN